MTVYKQIDTFQYASVSHILQDLMVCIAAIVSNYKVITKLEKHQKVSNLQTLSDNQTFEKREYCVDLYREA